MLYENQFILRSNFFQQQHAENVARQHAENVARQHIESVARQQAAENHARQLAETRQLAEARQQAENLPRQHAENLPRQHVEPPIIRNVSKSTGETPFKCDYCPKVKCMCLSRSRHRFHISHHSVKSRAWSERHFNQIIFSFQRHLHARIIWSTMCTSIRVSRRIDARTARKRSRARSISRIIHECIQVSQLMHTGGQLFAIVPSNVRPLQVFRRINADFVRKYLRARSIWTITKWSIRAYRRTNANTATR